LSILKKGGSNAHVGHVANDGRQFALVIKDGSRLINDANLLLPGDKKEGGDLLGVDALPKVIFRPVNPLGINHGGGFQHGVATHFSWMKQRKQ
jgi:hypothetical protein